MTDERVKELSKIYENVITSGLPWYTDFATDEERKKYLADTYAGATLEELLDIGIDPFK